MVAGVAAELLGRAALDHGGCDVAPVRQEALADDPAVAVDVALATGELLPGDQRGERGRRLRSARRVDLGGIESLSRVFRHCRPGR